MGGLIDVWRTFVLASIIEVTRKGNNKSQYCLSCCKCDQESRCLLGMMRVLVSVHPQFMIEVL